jgi:uncharacterized membrane protein
MVKRKYTKEEIEEYRKIHGAFFYYNKEDSNIFIPKAYGIGWTLNWSSPIAWILVIAIFILIAVRKFF